MFRFTAPANTGRLKLLLAESEKTVGRQGFKGRNRKKII
jgi:hypothetical protein